MSVNSRITEIIKSISPLNEAAVLEAKEYQSTLAMPPESMGELLEIGSRLSGITGLLHNSLPKKRILVLCADNGVAEEGVSSAPQSVTASQAVNMTRYLTGMSSLALHFKNEVQVVDVGIKCDYDCPEILNKKIRKGTASFLQGPAMSREEAEKALLVGIELSESAKADGVSVLGVGEMGIANTTTSTAVLSVLTGLDPEEITGRGGCITDKMLSHKKEVIKKGIELNKPNKDDVIDVLAKVGGLDLAAMCGVFLGVAKNKLPVVIDGYISVVAALCAARICPLSAKYFFPSHCSEEKGYKIAINELSLAPYLNLRMRLGEGSGCPLAFEIMDAACTIMNDMATFEKAKINDSYLDEVKTESGKRKAEIDELKTEADISAEEKSSFQFSTFNFQLITGGCKNGKSSYAQNLACKIAKKAGSAPIYFATMIPHDSEDEERIQKHRDDRKDLGFETIEVGKNLSTVVEKLEAGRVILFDSLTALLANELFEGRRDFSLPIMQEESEKIVQKIEENIEKLIQKSASVIFVTDEIYCDGKYDEITELYRKNLARIGQFVAKKCEILNAQCGILAEKSDNLPKGEESLGSDPACGGKPCETGFERVSVKAVPEPRATMATPFSPTPSAGIPRNAPSFSALIVGGAYQGKRAFAKEKFSLSDNDIFVCKEDCEPDFSKVCISHYENYVAYCLKNNVSPRTDFPESIIICDDIFCGVVPVDSFQRKLREECGLALQKIASTTSVYRVLCGIAEKIK